LLLFETELKAFKGLRCSDWEAAWTEPFGFILVRRRKFNINQLRRNACLNFRILYFFV
jgi:hypothetical protein